jgi:mannose-P-dolichol utilization defect protein 1
MCPLPSLLPIPTGQLGRPLITTLYDANNLLVLVARLPQIAQNLRTRSTGQLSLVTYGVQTLGCVARIFTTRQEGGGSAMLRAYIIGGCGGRELGCEGLCS